MARVARVMVMAMRVAGDEEGEGKGGEGDGDRNKGGGRRGRDKLIGVGRNFAGEELRSCNSIICNSLELQFWD
jgi:hypothetical protein